MRAMWLHNPWLQLILTTPVMFWCGKYFFIGAWKGLKNISVDMNTLVALGTGSAYCYSLFPTFLPDIFTRQGLNPDVYYEAAAVIITLAKHRYEEAVKNVKYLVSKL